MISLSLNESTRAAALDGALSFSILLQNQRELARGTAQSTVGGLLTAIKAAPGDYGELVDTLSATADLQTQAASKLTEPRWVSSDPAVSSAVAAAIQFDRDTALQAAKQAVAEARDVVTAAKISSANPSAGRTLAESLEAAADGVLTALTQLEAGQREAGSVSLLNAQAQLFAKLTEAQTRLSQLQTQTPVPTTEIATLQTLIGAAHDLLSSAAATKAVFESLASAASGATPTSFSLNADASPALHLAVWGESGVFSLTDANGQGVLVSADGRVDTLPRSGEGWQFAETSTFLLPDGTKVTVTPGDPGAVLATRGEQVLEISPFGSGVPAVISQADDGGRAADASQNDGYIFDIGSDAKQWSLEGASLGDVSGSREQVALVHLENEREVDVTPTQLPPELRDRLIALGLKPEDFDVDGDGLYSLDEINTVLATLDALVGGVQAQFETSLETTATALESLLRLNRFLEKMLAEADRKQSERREVSSEERDELQRILADLNRARRSLGEPNSVRIPLQSNPVEQARLVLSAVSAFTKPPRGDQAAVSSVPTLQDPPVRSGGDRPAPLPNSAEPLPPINAAMRRAERLLNALGGGPRTLGVSGEDSSGSARPFLNTDGSEVAPPSTYPAPESAGTTEVSGLAPIEPDATALVQTTGDRGGSSLPDTLGTPIPVTNELLRNPDPLTAELGDQKKPEPTPLPASSDRSPAVSSASPRPAAQRFDDASPLSSVAANVGEVLVDPVVREPNQPDLTPASATRDGRSSPTQTSRVDDLPAPAPARELGGEPPRASDAPRLPAARLNGGASIVNVSLPPDGPANASIGSSRIDSPRDELRVESERPSPSPLTPEPSGVRGPEPLPDSALRSVSSASLAFETPNERAPLPPSPATDVAKLQRETQRRVSEYRVIHADYLQRANQAQASVKTVVEQFLTLVGKDDELRQVFTTDDLTDEQRQTFREKIVELERETGVAWGSEPGASPRDEVNLAARALRSGLMI